MTIIKDKNGNVLITVTDPVTEDYVTIAGKKIKVINAINEGDDMIVFVDTNLLLED